MVSSGSNTVEGVHPIAQEANEILIAVCVLRGRSEFEIIYKLKHILITLC